MFFFFDQSPAKFSLANVFNAYGPGSWLEPRLGYMWQENTGLTPTVSSGQTTGLLLDNSKSAVINPSATIPAPAVYNSSCTISSSGNQHTITGIVNGSIFVYFTVGLGQNKGYRYELTYINSSKSISILLAPQIGLSTIALGTGYGAKSANTVVTGTSTALLLGFNGAIGDSITFTLDAVREIQGNHAAQATVANRPTLQYNNGLPFVRCDSNDFMTVYLPNLGSGVFSSSGSVYFALPTGMSALHGQSIGTSYSAPIQSMDLYGVYIFSSRLPTSIETQLQRYCANLAGL